MIVGRKRPRQEDDDVSDDPMDGDSDAAMDVDDNEHSVQDYYSEHQSQLVAEEVNVDTRIAPTNKGFTLLTKLGWIAGQPLGLSPDARVDPIPFQYKADSIGIGKLNQDVRVIQDTVSQRRELDSERQQKETEEQRKARQDSVARQNALQSEISTTLRAFYCTLCQKQFTTVAQYDTHTNSYAHHHKARFKDMQANVRVTQLGEVEKRKEKERRQEEKQLRKLAAAAGIRMPKTVNAAAPATTVLAMQSPAPITPPDGASKKSAWAPVGRPSTPPPPAAPPPDVPPAPLAEPSSQTPPLSPLPPPVDEQPPTETLSGWKKFQLSNAKRR